MNELARKRREALNEKAINEDLIILPGCGATMSVGSDRHPYYVSCVLPNGVVGIYSPSSRFDDSHPWEGGTMVVDAYDSTHKPDIYIKRRYGKWWECDEAGKTFKRRFTSRWERLSFGHAESYQDPSF